MKKFLTVLQLSIVLAFFSACGQGEATPLQSTVEEETDRWKTEGFAVPGELEEKQILWAGQYMLWEHKDQSTEEEELLYLDSGVCGELFWYLGTRLGADGMRVQGSEGQYVLETYNTADGKFTAKWFSPKELGQESQLGFFVDMDMPDGEHCAFRWVDYERDGEGIYCQNVDRIICTDFKGNCWAADFWEIYLEKGITREEFTELPLLQSVSWCSDGEGNIGVLCGESGFSLFHKNGEMLLDYEKNPEQQILEPLRTAGGELILPVYDGDEKIYEFLWVDTEEGIFRPLVQMEASRPCISQIYGMTGEDIYYKSLEGIVRWNIKSGENVQVLGFQTAGISVNYQTMLALRKGQTPVLRLTRCKEGVAEEWFAPLEEQKPTVNEAVRIADLSGFSETGERMAQCAVLAALENPNFYYEYEDASSGEARDRIMVQLSQGEGPELLFVTLEDMYLLEEKGLLLDMEELISAKLRAKLLPGALETGTVEERLMGVPIAVRAETLAVSEDVWSENTWKLEDIIELMEEGKLTGAIRSPFVMNDYLPPALTVLELVNSSLEDSFLIDWESRTSHFDDERFIRLLELTGKDMSGVSAPTEAWLEDGKNMVWGYFTTESDFLDFYEHMEKEGGQIVGYPAENGCGSYLLADGGVLVVNANIARKEAAACFLQALFGEEMQAKPRGLCLSACRLIPEDYIVLEESGRPVFLGGKNALEVPVFPDGTTALHRAGRFLESCTAVPRSYSQITKMVSEELDAMYAQDRSPEAVAEIINSRVQLYLDEGN